MLTVCKNNFTQLAAAKSITRMSVMAILREKMNSRGGRFTSAFFMILAAMVISQGAFAWTIPATGSFGYNIYDIAMNKVANGPIGFTGGAWLIAMGATKMNEGWMRALPFILGGSCLIKVEELTQSLGAIIH